MSKYIELTKEHLKKMLNAPVVGNIYQSVVSKPPQKALTGQDRSPGLRELSSSALIFSTYENCPGILLFAYTN